MMIVHQANVAMVTGSRELSGRTTGRLHHSRLFAAASCGKATLVVFDLAQVDIITGSYFDAAMWKFWTDRACRLAGGATPVLANMTEQVADEIEYVLGFSSAAVWSGRFDLGTFVPSMEPLGVLDDVTKAIISVLHEHDSVSAQDVADQLGKRVVSAYANRLSGMQQQHLVRRRQHGRGYRYMLPWKDVTNG